MKAVYTVHVKRHTFGASDRHGNAASSWGSAEPLLVYGIAPSVSPNTSPEPGADRLAVTTGLSLLMPPDAVLGALDRVLVDGVEYEVDGEVADYSRTPFARLQPGKVANLTRTEG